MPHRENWFAGIWLGEQRNLNKIWIFTVTQIILVTVNSDKSRATLWRLFLGFQNEPSICPFTCQDDWQHSNAGLWMFTIKVGLFKWWQLLYTMVKGTGAPWNPEKGNTPKLLSSQSQSLTQPNLHSTLTLTHEYTHSTGSKGNKEGSRKVCTREKRNRLEARHTVTAGTTRSSNDHNSAAIVASLMRMMRSRWVDCQQVHWPKVEICNATPPRQKGVRTGGREGHTITSTDRKPGRIGGPWHHISKSNNYSERPPYLAGNYLHIIIIVKSLIEKIH